MNDQDEPHTETVFSGSLKKRTTYELLSALGYDRAPSEMHALSTVLVTALGSLSREAKADLLQFLAERPEQEPQGAPLPERDQARAVPELQELVLLCRSATARHTLTRQEQRAVHDALTIIAMGPGFLEANRGNYESILAELRAATAEHSEPQGAPDGDTCPCGRRYDEPNHDH